MEEVTLLDLANEIGVTKSAINQKLTQEDKEKYLVKKGNKYIVNENGQIAIKSMFKKRISSEKSTPRNTYKNDKLLDNIMESSKADKEQIKEKDKQIEKMQKLLDQQQQLHLQANQRIEYLEKQLALDPPKAEQSKQEQSDLEERLKALESENKEYEEANNDFAKVNHQLEEQLEELLAKKWYQFWKR